MRSASAVFCPAEGVMLCQKREQTLGQEVREIARSNE